MIRKVGLVFLMLLAIAGIVLSFVYFLKFQQERNKAIELKNEAVKLNISLTQTLDSLEIAKNDLESTREILQKKSEELQALLDSLGQQDEAIKEALRKQNALIKIGITSYGRQSTLDKVEGLIQNEGYDIWYSRRESGSTKENRIYVYSDGMHEIADNLVTLLSEQGISLRKMEGQGRGLSYSDKNNTLVIHLKQ